MQSSDQNAPGFSIDDSDGITSSEAVPGARYENTAQPRSGPASTRRPSAIMRMFAPGPSRPGLGASHVSFAEQLDGNEEQGMDQQHVEPSDDKVGRRVPGKDRSESACEDAPSEEVVVQLPPHDATNEEGASDTTQPMHEDGCSEDSYEMAAAIDSFDVAQEHMSSSSSPHTADILFANGTLSASLTVAASDV